MSASCCAAETSKDVITFTLPQGVSRLRAKVQSFPTHCKEGGFGGETSSGFIANSVLCTCIAKQLSSVLPGSAAKYRMWLETIFAQEPCCSYFSCTACVRILLQYRNALRSRYSPYFCKHLEIKSHIFLDSWSKTCFVNSFGAKLECKATGLPCLLWLTTQWSEHRCLLFNFIPAFLKQTRAQLKEKGEGTGVVLWHVGVQHLGTDCLTGCPSDPLVNLPGKHKENLHCSPTHHYYLLKLNIRKTFLMESIIKNPNETIPEISESPPLKF